MTEQFLQFGDLLNADVVQNLEYREVGPEVTFVLATIQNPEFRDDNASE